MTPTPGRSGGKRPAGGAKAPLAKPAKATGRAGAAPTPAAGPPVAVEPAAFPFRPPTWVRIWVVTLGLVAAAVAVVIAFPLAVSGHWPYLLPVLIIVLLAVGLVWRVGGLIATPTVDGALLVRNRAKTFRLARADVAEVRAGTRSGRAGTPVVLLELTDGTEVAVDATLSAGFQQEALDRQVAAVQAWHQG